MGKNYRKSVSGSIEGRHLYVEGFMQRYVDGAGRKSRFGSAG